MSSALHAADAGARSAQVEWLSRRMLRCARQTRYGSGRSQRLDEWPVLPKSRALAAPADFINRRSLIRLPASSGGTTGTPLRLWRSLECVVAEQSFLDQLLAAYDCSMRSRVAVLRAERVKPAAEAGPPYGRLSHGGMRLTLSSLHLNAESLPWYVDALETFAPQVLWVYPSAAINLLRLMERAALRLSLPVILASSELLSARMHAELERFFSARVINHYGQAERVCFAWSTRPEEFFFHPLYGRVELQMVTASDPPAARIIGTGFWNTAMPLIRYDTGDLLYLPARLGADELAEIARGERPFAGLAGRSGEYLLTRAGLRIIGLNHIPRDIDNINQIQLVQTGWEALRIDVLATREYGESDERALRAAAAAKLPASFEVTVSRVHSLRQTAAGKTPFVIREVEPRR